MNLSQDYEKYLREQASTPWGRLRDNVAYNIANFALRHIATPWYRYMIDGSIRLGLDTASEEEKIDA